MFTCIMYYIVTYMWTFRLGVNFLLFQKHENFHMVLGSFLKTPYGKGLISAPTLNPWWTNNMRFKNKKQKPTYKIQSSIFHLIQQIQNYSVELA